MSKFESMGDKQLTVEFSMAVAKQKNPKAKSIESDYRQNCVWVETHGYHSEPLIDINSWADMGPIINTITEDLFAKPDWCVMNSCQWKYYIDACGGNAFKAAAIIYLKSLEEQ